MKRLLTLTVLSAALTASSALAATIVTYTDATAFNTSLIVGSSPSVVTENFNTNASVFTTFNAAGTVNGIPGFSGGPGDGQRDTRVVSGASPYSEIITLNAGNMVAFAANWNLAPGAGLGAGVNITIALAAGGTQTIQISPGVNANLGYNVGNGSTEFFFGFTSDAAFTSVTLSSASTAGLTAETLSFDDLTVAQSGAAPDPGPGPGPVPEPSTLGLMGAAMVGLGLIRRVRK